MSHTFTPPAEPLVEKNVFRGRERQPARIPDFAEIRPRLPEPVLPEDPGWIDLYWSAWRAFWDGLTTPPSGSALGAVYNRPKPGHFIEMGRSALFTNLSGYVPGSFQLVDILDNFYAAQHDDGFICRELVPDTGADAHQPYEPNSTGPSLLAWTEWRNFRLTEDKQRITKVFWPLMAYHRWCRANRTWRNGLYWTTAYASGLVNQPRVPHGRYHHGHWAWIDASAQASLDCTALERMAVLLGENELAEEIVAERDRLSLVINNEMWNDDLNFYQDIGPNGQFSPVKSIAAYWALLDPQLVPKERRGPFVQHLRDSWSFRTENVIPSLSADSDGYNARTGNGWRGAVWPSLTYMAMRGLQAADQFATAHKLAINHADLVCRILAETGHFWENYAPEDPTPGEPSEVDLAGLTAAAIVPMLIEFVLGVWVDWPLKQVTWRRGLEREQAYGIRNLPLGQDGSLDIVGTSEAIRIRTDAPFSLTIYDANEVVKTAVPAGEMELSFK